MADDDGTPATAAVLGLPELLEWIILQLPPKTIIIKAARVSHAWNATISSSEKIRRKLWFQTKKAPQSPISPYLDIKFNPEGEYPDYDQIIYLNPILQGAKFSMGTRTLQLRECSYGVSLKNPRRENHLCVHISTPNDASAETWLQAEKASIAQDSAWRQTFLTTPPCTRLSAQPGLDEDGDGETMEAEHDVYFDIYVPGGIKCGDVADALVAASKHCEESNRGVEFTVVWYDLFVQSEGSKNDFNVRRLGDDVASADMTDNDDLWPSDEAVSSEDASDDEVSSENASDDENFRDGAGEDLSADDDI